ncbi:MAG: FG-GAP-like repeat-containing protein [Bacteroidetes bacterium]|nr:FG-GAP-like repeat-containing protein [Bacteroidota bacterium]
MKQIFTSFLFFCLLPYLGQAQEFKPVSVNSGGMSATTTGGNYMVSYTVGQPYIGTTSTLSNGNYQLTPGFQQSFESPERFAIGAIDSVMSVFLNNTISFYYYSEVLGSDAMLYYRVDDPVIGALTGGPTGYFKYNADSNDRKPFRVTFFGILNNQVDSQQIIIIPEYYSVLEPGSFCGYSEGSFNIGESGNASYSFPLTVAPGTAGMQPDLSLVYSSMNSNGILGYGFLLSGLSMISRSPKTYAQDYATQPVQYIDGEDRYNLDGERLRVINGGTYGGNGSEYYTEQNSFQRITSSPALEGPEAIIARFLVQTKSGLTKEYGYTADSRIQAGGDNDDWIMYWALNRIRDTKGNYIDFKYFKNPVTKEFYPDMIKYTGNLNTGLQPYAFIKFFYQVRPDSSSKYMGGSVVTRNHRLSGMRMMYLKGTDTLIAREYRFEYAASTWSKLIRVREFGQGGILVPNNELSPVQFEWQANTDFDLTLQKDKISPALLAAQGVTMIESDFNKDGYTDILLYKKADGTNDWLINNHRMGFRTPRHNLIPPALIANGMGISTGDWNGDGITDLMWWDNSASGATAGANRWFVIKPSVTDSLTYTQYNSLLPPSMIKGGDDLYVSDFNGDALQDVLWYKKSDGNTTFYFNTYDDASIPSFNNSGINLLINATGVVSLENIDHFYILDLNGDGLSDILFWNKVTGDNWWFLNSGSSTVAHFAFKAPIMPLLESHLTGGTSINFGDWNGDGTIDIMWYDNSTGENRWFVGKGDLKFEPTGFNWINPDQLKCKLLPGEVPIFYFNDFNADGLTDLLWSNYNTGATRWFINKGKGKFQVEDYLTSNELMKEGSGFKFGDWMGTGNCGLVCYDKQGHNFWLNNEVKRTNLVQGIREGNGMYTRLEYKSAVDSSVYERGPNCSYPILNFISPMQLISSYSKSNGVDGMNTTDYFYYHGKVNARGRGFMGYDKVTAADRLTGLKSVSIFNRDSLYLGNSLIKECQLLPSGDTISVTDHVKGMNDLFSSYYTFDKQTTTRKYELNGTLYSTQIRKNFYDLYGNLTKQITDYGGGYIDTLKATYVNDSSYWLLGRMTRIVLTRKAPGQPVQSRTSAFEYEMTPTVHTGLLKKEITEPDIDSLKLVKEYTYDAYGNIISSSETGMENGVAITRQNQSTYDSRGRLILNKTNALGQSESKTYEEMYGNVISETGPNGLTTEWELDRIGRIVKERRPGNDFNNIFHYRADEEIPLPHSRPDGAYYAKINEGADSRHEITWCDSLARVIRTEIEGFNGQWIEKDIVYNALGDKVKVSQPYFRGSQPTWTLTSYDILSRVVSETSPEGRITTYTYNGYTSLVTNPLGQTTTRTTNPLNKDILVTDNAGNQLAYIYSSLGNLIRINDPAGNQTIMTYDLSGNRTSLSDPDLGLTRNRYNAFGQVIWEKDAKNQVSTFHYDLLGRMTDRSIPEGTITYTYDTQPMGTGKPATVNYSANNSSITYYYDSLGRVNRQVEVYGGNSYPYRYSYTTQGRVDSLYYPNGMSVRNRYDPWGYLEYVQKGQDTLWKALASDASGHTTRFKYKNGVYTQNSFDTDYGSLVSSKSIKGLDTLQYLAMTYDFTGKLSKRQDIKRHLVENFTYDNLNRLTSAVVAGLPPLTMQYDLLGNLTYKSDVGSYAYGETGAGPHAVTSINGVAIDSTRFLASLQGNVLYASFEKAINIVADNRKVSFDYGFDLQRRKMQSFRNDTLKLTRLYFGLYEKEISGDTVRETCYIKAGGMVFAMVKTDNHGLNATWFLHRDHLGSLSTISNAAGQLVATYSYDPWGNRRDPANWETPKLANPYSGYLCSRGFTGHEMLDLVSLINMNGRLYDPVIGRFLTADPYVQSIYNLQSLNHFSYCLNNPILLVDPSGFGISGFTRAVIGFVCPWAVMATFDPVKAFWEQHKKEIIVVAATIALSVALGPAGLGVATMVGGEMFGAVMFGAAVGFGSAFIAAKVYGATTEQALNTGVKGAILGGICGGLTYGLGGGGVIGERPASSFSTTDFAAKVVGRGYIQGLMVTSQGGKFKDGFVEGAGSEAANYAFSYAVSGAEKPMYSLNDPGVYYGEINSKSFSAGLFSGEGGVKFVNGAATESFRIIFNESYQRTSWGRGFLDNIELRNLVTLPTNLPSVSPLSLIPKGILETGVLNQKMGEAGSVLSNPTDIIYRETRFPGSVLVK